ncbi:hypothetical protein Nepgr_008844 [Nepenthes gracilis]|uniref:Uncharacterized protein n=1 Tax=Nepenthes gracilis TaxID=150966 RepID=A0AAD3XJN9_NEPGR|nr:hypothetical protein Nepgr_008844 [Nepenthes gracilis]
MTLYPIDNESTPNIKNALQHQFAAELQTAQNRKRKGGCLKGKNEKNVLLEAVMRSWHCHSLFDFEVI